MSSTMQTLLVAQSFSGADAGSGGGGIEGGKQRDADGDDGDDEPSMMRGAKGSVSIA